MRKEDSYPWLKSYPSNLNWDMKIEKLNVYQLLQDSVEKNNDQYGFDFLGKRLKWSDIHLAVDQFATSLQHLGVEKGVKVGLFLPNSPYFVIAYYAALKIGAVAVHYNPLYAHEDLAHQIEDSHTDFMVTCDLKILTDKTDVMLRDTRLQKVILCPFVDLLPFPKSILFSLFKRSELSDVRGREGYVGYEETIRDAQAFGDFKPVEIDPEEDLAVLQYTGGTTGTPKGAMLTHKNVVTNALQAAEWLSAGDEEMERTLGILPFFYVFAMTAVMNLAVVKGMEIVALPRFDLNQTLNLIHKKKPHLMAAVPAIFNAINHHKNLDKYDLSSLKRCISGGAPLPVEVKKKFEALTGAVVVEGYGLTESSPVLCCNPVAGENKAGSIGLPFPQTEIVIVDPDDKEKVLGIGERGELCAFGPQVMKGYWGNEEESASTLYKCEDGRMRLHTGDIAIMDEDGYLFIVDRLKDMIITNGYNVYPRNIEEAIYRHEAVEECIVAGLPDENRGEIVKAWIKLKEGHSLSEEDLRAFLKEICSPMEVPRKFEFRDEPLPKTMIGKLSRKDVLEQEKS